MLKEIAVDLPYPSIDEISCDKAAASIIYPAFMGAHSELNAIIQYIYHELEYREQDQDKIAQILMGISLSEMHHFHILGKTLKKLGANSIFYDFPQQVRPINFCGNLLNGKDLNRMILDDIVGEMIAIEKYEKMQDALSNEYVKKVIERIVLDEKLHLKTLKECLNG